MISSRLKRRIYKYLKYLPGLKVLAALFIGLLILLALWRLTPPLVRLFKNRIWQPTTFLTGIMRGKPNLKSTNGRVNILLLGAGGANHAAGDLTDSLIFASVDLKSGQVLLLSLPRDIWVDSLKAKINTAYHWGEEKKKGGGLLLAKAVVGKILDQPVHYGLLLDFDGFVKAVDLVGGVEVEVERAFDDYKYPIPGQEEAEPEEARYEHIHFDAGRQHMDGERALKYIRSRYAEGEEGTDFARAKRQQRFLSAFRAKIFSTQTFLNPQKISQLARVFTDSVDTDIPQEKYPEFLKLALKIKEAAIETYVLNEGLLYHPQEKIYGQWVLLPKAGNWSKVHQYVQSLLK